MNPLADSKAPAARKDFLETLDVEAEALDIRSPAHRFDNELPIGELRRMHRWTQPDPIEMLNLVEDMDGILSWSVALDLPPAQGRRRRAGGLPARGRILRQYKFERLAPSAITSFLTSLDLRISPRPGLLAFRATDGRFVPMESVHGAKRRLLFVHGTFSNTRQAFADLFADHDFMQRAAGRYEEILAFEHPTLAVGPLLNATDLASHLAGAEGPLDVICHSRGAIVARWWLETASSLPDVERAVLIGAPLAGTSLASPSHLRSSLKLLTNVAWALCQLGAPTASVSPILSVVAGLMKVVASLTAVAATTPVVDAVVGMVPGLLSMARTRRPDESETEDDIPRHGSVSLRQNPELARLHGRLSDLPVRYLAVTSAFQPPHGESRWRFWDSFVRLREQTKSAAADLVFEEPNDLVVDTDSMTDLGDGRRIERGLHFGPAIAPDTAPEDFHPDRAVDHVSYFAQPETRDFLARELLAREES